MLKLLNRLQRVKQSFKLVLVLERSIYSCIQSYTSLSCLMLQRFIYFTIIKPNNREKVKAIRFDPLAPFQTLVQRCTLQMKMFIFISYIMNLNCGCQKIVYSLPPEV